MRILLADIAIEQPFRICRLEESFGKLGKFLVAQGFDRGEFFLFCRFIE
jgi:hypothetical protein